MKQLLFSYNFLLRGYFCGSKCPGPAVANSKLRINSHVMNRVEAKIIIKTIPVMTVFSDVGINICCIHFDITTSFDEFNGGSAFLG